MSVLSAAEQCVFTFAFLFLFFLLPYVCVMVGTLDQRLASIVSFQFHLNILFLFCNSTERKSERFHISNIFNVKKIFQYFYVLSQSC